MFRGLTKTAAGVLAASVIFSSIGVTAEAAGASSVLSGGGVALALAQGNRLENISTNSKVPIEAPLDVRLSRVKTRKRNPSDIRSGEQLEEQLSAHIGVIDWHCINTNRERNDTISAAVKILAQAGIDVIERKE